MPPNERRFLLCNDKCVKECDLHLYPKHHILGELVYMSEESKSFVALDYWDIHYFTFEPLPTSPKVGLHGINGYIARIECKAVNCNNAAHWEIGKAGLTALELRYEKAVTQ